MHSLLGGTVVCTTWTTEAFLCRVRIVFPISPHSPKDMRIRSTSYSLKKKTPPIGACVNGSLSQFQPCDSLATCPGCTPHLSPSSSFPHDPDRWAVQTMDVCTSGRQCTRYDALGNITDSGITIRALGSQHHCTPTQPSFGLQKLSGWKQCVWINPTYNIKCLKTIINTTSDHVSHDQGLISFKEIVSFTPPQTLNSETDTVWFLHVARGTNQTPTEGNCVRQKMHICQMFTKGTHRNHPTQIM